MLSLPHWGFLKVNFVHLSSWEEWLCKINSLLIAAY